MSSRFNKDIAQLRWLSLSCNSLICWSYSTHTLVSSLIYITSFAFISETFTISFIIIFSLTVCILGFVSCYCTTTANQYYLLTSYRTTITTITICYYFHMYNCYVHCYLHFYCLLRDGDDDGHLLRRHHYSQ